MVGIECLKKISPICISKRLGLYLKNTKKDDEKEFVYELLAEDFNKECKKINY